MFCCTKYSLRQVSPQYREHAAVASPGKVPQTAIGRPVDPEVLITYMMFPCCILPLDAECWAPSCSEL